MDIAVVSVALIYTALVKVLCTELGIEIAEGSEKAT